MCEEKQASADVQETALAELDKNILLILLKDRSTGKNILWATDDYKDLGIGFAADDEITLPAITGAHGNLIKPRALKSKEEQGARTRNMAEVFTPLWICNKQNNLADNAWFGRENVFNTENGTDWQATEGKIAFPGEDGADGWRAYIASKRLEITCGEAPYLASRYDTMTGEIVPLAIRIGLLDRKLRVINERTRNLKDRERAKKRWLELATLAVRSTYGFEWAGDNILLARENLLFTVADYYAAKFGDALDMEMLEHFAETISWNIWQMDGLKAVVPNSCHDYKKERQAVTPNLFAAKDFSARTLKRSVSPCDVDEDERQKCQGCLKDNIDLHNGIYCRIKNWSTGKVLLFKDMLDGEGSEGVMSKDFKFDVVIGNPPYQTSDGGSGTGISAKPVYHYFVSNAIKLNPKYILMITPSRWFAGGKGLDEFRNVMLNDDRFKLIMDYMSSKDCFDNVNIAGGVNYFLWDKDHTGNCEIFNCSSEQETISDIRPLNEFPLFIRDNRAISIIHKFLLSGDACLADNTFTRNPFGFVSKDRGDDKSVKDDDLKLISSAGVGYVRNNSVVKNREQINKYKVTIGKIVPSNGEVDTDPRDGYKVTTSSRILAPGEIHTESYLLLHGFETKLEADNFAHYMALKFPRFMMKHTLSSMNISTQNFMFVPFLDYTREWTDEDLYNRYGLDEKERQVVEQLIRPME